MSIEVGEYVRTKKGDIRKVIDILIKHIVGKGKPYSVYYLDDKRIGYVRSKYIVKHSVNIIDLIEVGDIIDYFSSNLGRNVKIEVDCINTKEEDYKWGRGFVTTTLDEHIFLEDIKSILTHQQFKEMEYKIKE